MTSENILLRLIGPRSARATGCLVFAAIVLFGATAAADVTRTGYSAIVVGSTGKCMDVAGNSTAPLAAVNQWRCSTGLNQQWNLQPFGGGFRVISQRSGLCLAVSANSNVAGMPLIQDTCNTTDAGQVWTLTASGGGHRLISKGSGLCATVTGNGVADGDRLIQDACGSGSNFTWTFSAGLFTATTVVNVQAVHSGKCLGVPTGNVSAGAAAAQTSCAAPPAVALKERWTLVPSGNNYRVVVQQGSNLCLAVTGGSTGANAKVVQAACGSAGSLWTLKPQGKVYQLVAEHSGQCLTVPGSSQGESVQATQTVCSTSNVPLNQLWTFSLADATGGWDPTVYAMAVNAVAIANLPNGKLLMWSAYREDNWQNDTGNAPQQTWTGLYNPADHSSTKLLVTSPGDDMFCPGTTNLTDGRILVNGGTSSTEASIYDQGSATVAPKWTSTGDMVIPRGYEANTLVPDGSVFTLGGSWSGGTGGKNGEIWTNGVWRALSGVPVADFVGPERAFRSDNHMWLFSLSNGRIFHAGPSVKMHWITTAGAGAWTAAGNRGNDAYAINGNATLYAPNLIMKAGGAPLYDAGTPIATTSTYVISVNPATPSASVKQVAPMTFARAYSNSVILPDGSVLMVGGQLNPKPFNETGSVRVPELWDPETQVYKQLKPMQTNRTYHSTAILLPDGTVFVGGGGLCGTCGVNRKNAEILTPPNLLTGEPRPVIASAPTTGVPGGTLAVTTSIPVKSFALLRLSSTTHTVNNDQRRVPLTINSTAGATSYTLGVPADTGVVLPGYYMLFALSPSGVPSVSKTIRIN